MCAYCDLNPRLLYTCWLTCDWLGYFKLWPTGLFMGAQCIVPNCIPFGRALNVVGFVCTFEHINTLLLPGNRVTHLNYILGYVIQKLLASKIDFNRKSLLVSPFYFLKYLQFTIYNSVSFMYLLDLIS